MALEASFQLVKSLEAYTGIPGYARKDEVVQKRVLSNSLTNTQLGSEFQPGRIGLVYSDHLVVDVSMVGAAWIACAVSRDATGREKGKRCIGTGLPCLQ